MAKFKYKFESIKRIKETIEKKTQKELSVIDLEIDKVKERIVKLLEDKKNRREERLAKKTLKVSELKFYENFDKSIDEKIELEKIELQSLLIDREEKKNELLEKSKETKMFDKLKEKHYLDFMKEQNKQEQIEIDDIATKKFVRGK